MSAESLFPLDIGRSGPDTSLSIGEHSSQRTQDFLFAMASNGYLPLENGAWIFNSDLTKPLIEEFKGQRVSFFGPNSYNDLFSSKDVGLDQSHFPFEQEPIIDVIRKYRQIDEEQAARIAFLLGGIVRHLHLKRPDSSDEIANAVKFAARMTKLGDQRSGDAVASAMAMYVISEGSLAEDKRFVGHVYHMAEAIREDPTNPKETKDLGLSQVMRLRNFMDKVQPKERRPFPDIADYEEALEEFPTVGAEFHFSASAAKDFPYFWQRLALLNMSQYQRGSYVQLCRNDRGVIEVRMNPSIYPITIANWNHLRLLLPELNRAYFTVTINRNNENFSWSKDQNLPNNLRALGMLSYAGMFENVPLMGGKEEIDFGQIYLGQTVKLHEGKYNFSGNWLGGEGQHGQLSIYAGFGDTFPRLAYYLSMALANPNILKAVSKDSLSKIKTLTDALAARQDARRGVFEAIQRRVETDERLRKAHDAGSQIIALLNP